MAPGNDISVVAIDLRATIPSRKEVLRARLTAVLATLFLATTPFAQAQTSTNGAQPVPPDVGPVITPTNAAADVPAPAPPDSTASVPPPDASAPASAPPPQFLPPGANGTPGSQQDQIEDIRPPVFYLHPWFWIWFAVLAALAVALVAFLWNLFKPHRQLSAKSAYELTLERLNQARELLREEEPMPYAVFVSETVRSYLGQRFETPSTRRTTEEFLRLMEADTDTPLAEHRDLLRQFLQACDLVKFAKYQPTLEELEQVQQRAVSFVTATRPVETPGKGERR